VSEEMMKDENFANVSRPNVPNETPSEASLSLYTTKTLEVQIKLIPLEIPSSILSQSDQLIIKVS